MGKKGCNDSPNRWIMTNLTHQLPQHVKVFQFVDLAASRQVHQVVTLRQRRVHALTHLTPKQHQQKKRKKKIINLLRTEIYKIRKRSKCKKSIYFLSIFIHHAYMCMMIWRYSISKFIFTTWPMALANAFCVCCVCLRARFVCLLNRWRLP